MSKDFKNKGNKSFKGKYVNNYNISSISKTA